MTPSTRWIEPIDLLRHPQEFGAISSQYLPYVSILPVFAALQAAAGRSAADRQLDAQRKIRHWYWASVFTNRYSGSVESTSARDFLDVKAWFEDDAAEPALIAEFEARFARSTFAARPSAAPPSTTASSTCSSSAAHATG